MPTSDQTLSFLLAALLHLLGLLLFANGRLPYAKQGESEPELEVASVELTLASLDPESPATTPAAGAAAAEPEAALPPVELPPPAETPTPPVLPEKPAFTEALAPPPEPVPAPQPAPAQPAPQPAAAPTATAPAATAQPPVAAPGDSAETATLRPSGGSFGRVDAHPSLTRPIKPNYPIGARRRGEEGSVILDVSVGADGRARSVTLVSSSRFPDLDAAAERAAAQARFKPATRNGRPVDAAARITIIFRLRDQ